ncbi:4-(cytidine 5'-diphospho)-2-C-methyl-D-erythritol kinase [Sediminibacterium sp.]|uniref:4-(cytidine 5'-diphospho)-2-C-methyl-D-erythritol kinase n=1 Tax=Sediminibacterium sp. TaxID=1917865 RepID=UPI0027346B2E|nr:4-(cytidine 5'-diphospho)-2-C-methyl-D-erythritol kinase [Sediminibacterium sp.]MDP3392783.1 4-(cytidine 5'-diphospho)-2-C-methyl-D-erythritol kinase [Sediminibacterium sp.]MDP3565905.1 4-(cytidine 5'-diphospho)-2-C-methyl-D-erythritol kinase [Sediminibacterium sp.]
MVIFPNCKINLGLHITGKRPDGFHELETVFYPVQLKDILEVVTSTTQHFQSTGLDIPGNTETNLCLKAYHLLKQDFPDLPSVHMHLHKLIPMGAGLGGGSADGAFALRLLNEKYKLNITNQQLIEYAAKLGSDCPFFIMNTACYATGRGEKLNPIQLDLSNYHFVLVNPGIHVNTKWAFEQITPTPSRKNLVSILEQPIEEWPNHLFNDFEAPISKAYPEIEHIKTLLYQQGASYAAMSGSGSTVFGIFKTRPSNNIHSAFNGSVFITA